MGTMADDLKADHEDMRTMVAVMLEMSNRLETGQDVPPDDIRTLLQYLDTFVTRSHHMKEEELLFPALEEAGLKRDGGPLEIMSAEHQLEVNFLAGLAQAASRLHNGDPTAAAMVAQYARDYAALLSRDMEQEDTLIYPLAEQQLPQRTQDELVQQFDELETQILGVQKHDHYHKMARRLAELYLN